MISLEMDSLTVHTSIPSRYNFFFGRSFSSLRMTTNTWYYLFLFLARFNILDPQFDVIRYTHKFIAIAYAFEKFSCRLHARSIHILHIHHPSPTRVWHPWFFRCCCPTDLVIRLSSSKLPYIDTALLHCPRLITCLYAKLREWWLAFSFLPHSRGTGKKLVDVNLRCIRCYDFVRENKKSVSWSAVLFLGKPPVPWPAHRYRYRGQLHKHLLFLYLPAASRVFLCLSLHDIHVLDGEFPV
jgi:hypothetical protein